MFCPNRAFWAIKCCAGPSEAILRGLAPDEHKAPQYKQLRPIPHLNVLLIIGQLPLYQHFCGEKNPFIVQNSLANRQAEKVEYIW